MMHVCSFAYAAGSSDVDKESTLLWHKCTHTYTYTDTQTHRHTDTHTHTQSQTVTHVHTHTHTVKHTHTQSQERKIINPNAKTPCLVVPV